MSKILQKSLIMLFCISMTISGQSQKAKFVMEQIGPNNFLNAAWDLHYGPDDYLWVSERTNGNLLRVNPENGEKDQLIKISDISSTAGQDGLLGFALHPDFMGANPYVYASYTHLVSGERTQKIVRFTYSETNGNGLLTPSLVLIDNLPSSNDHNSGRMVIGPDEKLYYTIGDQGANQGGNYCDPNLAQVLPTQTQIDQGNWDSYPGKVLRMNLDGTIPSDNPEFDGVKSHVFTVGHRNAQGIVFGSNGLLYSDEHGPDTDDEVNILTSGQNYGWPNVAGYLDDQAYDYCNWSSAPNCESLNYSKSSCPGNAEFLEESDFIADNYQEPLFPMFAVTDDYDFNNPDCGNSWMCRPNVAPSSLTIYEGDGIPGWDKSLLVTSLKRGRIFRLKLNDEGTEVVGDTTQHIYTTNRYRDIVVDPDGKSFYVITDNSGKTSDASGLNQENSLSNPGTILKFTYNGTTSVQNKLNNDVFKVYPNPTKDKLYIEIEKEFNTELNAELINLTGAKVKSFSQLHGGLNDLDVTNQNSGIYILRVFTKTESWHQKVVIL